ncbi:uncharacterized protein LOC126984139 [Eriocheir sinensis]|uniref:uncharacterized protein LOC126984139 n=1 Tax=Eriocheir sinensis TaxID=95602 RepID=UPI0021CAC0E3|nr:uncharacterized protein LOC126984139 [Eriocheir sinensis]
MSISLTSFYGQNRKVIVPTNPAGSDDDQELDLSADDDADPDFEPVLSQDSSSEDELRPSHQLKRQKASSQTRNLAIADVEDDSGEDGSDQENTTSASSPSWEKMIYTHLLFPRSHTHSLIISLHHMNIS